MAEELTQKQRDVLTFIAGHTKTHGFPPTIRELGEHFGIGSTNGVNDHLNALQRKGYLDRYAQTARSLTLTSKAQTELGTRSQKEQAVHEALAALDKLSQKPLGERLDKLVNDARLALRKAGFQ